MLQSNGRTASLIGLGLGASFGAGMMYLRDSAERSTSAASPSRGTTDQKDEVTYKKGSANDQTMRGTTKTAA